LGKKKLAPLFLSLSLEQGGEFCWRHRPLLELKVAKPRGSAQAGFGGSTPCGIKVFITGLSVELKLDYVIDILSKIGISDKNNPHWAVTSDEISVIEADISSWGDVKAQQFEDVKRAVSVSVFSAEDWPLDSVITERTPLQGERLAPDSKALEGLADYDLSPEQARMFKAITNKHGWGVPPAASGAYCIFLFVCSCWYCSLSSGSVTYCYVLYRLCANVSPVLGLRARSLALLILLLGLRC
jgi:hypothetical protein